MSTRYDDRGPRRKRVATVTRCFAQAITNIRVNRLHGTNEDQAWRDWARCDEMTMFLREPERQAILANASRDADSHYEGYAINAGLDVDAA